jgi:large subunit ribosomal protein L24
MKVKKNDTVLVLTGKDAGKTAKVLVANPKANKVIVDGINVQKKHKKTRSAQEVSQIVNQSGPIDASNVMVVCPTCNKATRVAYQVEGDKKVRVCKKCGAVLDGKKEAKEVKKTAKKATTSKAKAKKAEKTAEETK